jgi:Domain of unknown function (DUF1844)
MSEEQSDLGFQVRDRRSRPDEATSPPPPRETKAQPTRSGGATAQGERNLIGLFVMLASAAAAAIEGVTDEASGDVRRDLQHASEFVDMLILLREKTDGRRTSEESKVLDDVIYELQCRYVDATRRPGR